MDESVQRNFVELDEVSKLLLKAADYIERNGWCQGVLRVGSRACIAGALEAVSPNLRLGAFDFDSKKYLFQFVVYRDAWKRLELATGLTVGNWNDKPGRTAEEVIGKLREVALEGHK
jgi:hypothetical protein